MTERIWETQNTLTMIGCRRQTQSVGLVISKAAAESRCQTRHALWSLDCHQGRCRNPLPNKARADTETDCKRLVSLSLPSSRTLCCGFPRHNFAGFLSLHYACFNTSLLFSSVPNVYFCVLGFQTQLLFAPCFHP